jgi:hypothetical protein
MEGTLSIIDSLGNLVDEVLGSVFYSNNSSNFDRKLLFEKPGLYRLNVTVFNPTIGEESLSKTFKVLPPERVNSFVQSNK